MAPSPSSASASAPLSDGRAELFALEPRFAGIEEAAGPLPWRTRPRGFAGILRTICGQQISNQAAGAIWTRLSALPGALTPEGLLALDDATLCGVAGLSRPKAAHARALAEACLDGRLDFARMQGLPDAEAIAMMSAVRGLGPWTSEVHLLFAEGRLDVFPSGDIALANSARHLFALEDRPKPVALARMALAWSPQRSLAARLLWHHWRHVTGRPLIEDP
ncbi:DNA-3-methyladenine glycosylase family protein [Roseococcus sp. YIM B11640]|uniref:DNA-3-methyladenine glycosylase family protein n=1 Tax=Roseococcus sp. YIM B11640 TaxID=3133973 RepID=UPI003C7BDC94